MHYMGPSVSYNCVKTTVEIDGKKYKAFYPDKHSLLNAVAILNESYQDDYNNWSYTSKVYIQKKKSNLWIMDPRYNPSSYVQKHPVEASHVLYEHEDKLTKDRYYTDGYIEHLKKEIKSLQKTLDSQMSFKKKMQKVWAANSVLLEAQADVND